MARYLLERGADPRITAERGETPLITAVTHGYARIVRLLVETRRLVSVVEVVSRRTPRRGHDSAGAAGRCVPYVFPPP